MSEQWRAVPGFPDYEVSDEGRIRSYRNRWGRRSAPKMFDPWITPQGYRRVTVIRDGLRTKQLLHVLVMAAFVGERPAPDIEIRHLNGNSLDNRLANLRYGTASENQMDRVRHGNHHWAARSDCNYGHPFTPENTKHRRSGSRICATCLNAYRLAWKSLTPEERAERKAAGLPIVDLAAYFADQSQERAA